MGREKGHMIRDTNPSELLIYKVLLVLVVIVNGLGLFNIIFTGDSALYATISKTIVTSGNYLDLYVGGEDWLDKPHFPFWICALSMELFGLNSFAYKLPSFIFFLMALWYTYKLGKELYSLRVGWVAMIIFGSALHIMISNNDVRAEAILMGVIMGGVYHMWKCSLSNSVIHFLLAAVFSACAIMTKGIFVLIIVYSAVLGDLLIRNPKALLSWKWPLLVLATGVFTLPELYALYHQFDVHPEKVVFERTGVSGVRFFLWDSQFGRFFNTGPITGKGDPLFFLHTFLWAFAPWAFLAIIPLFYTVRNLLGWRKDREYVTFFGFIIMFLVFSISGFQLPHYTNILFPFVAILTGRYLENLFSNPNVNPGLKMYAIILSVLFIIAVLGIQFLFAPGKWGVLVVLLLVFVGVFLALKIQSGRFQLLQPFIGLVLAILLVGGYVNTVFYPRLLSSYQAGYSAAQYYNSLETTAPVIALEEDWLLTFYTDGEVYYDIEKGKNEGYKELFIYGSDQTIHRLDKERKRINEVKTFPYFHITKINGKFLNTRTRAEVLKQKKLYKLEGE